MKTLKKGIALLLVLAMSLSMMSLNVFAEDVVDTPSDDVETVEVATEPETPAVEEQAEPTAEPEEETEAVEPAAEVEEETEAVEPAAETEEETEAVEPAAEVEEETEAVEPAAEAEEETEAVEPEEDAEEVEEEAEEEKVEEKQEEPKPAQPELYPEFNSIFSGKAAGYAVTVMVPAGSFAEGVTFHAALLTWDDLGEDDKALLGGVDPETAVFFDLAFLNDAGDEIEPLIPVDMSISLASDALPEDAETVDVLHIAEDAETGDKSLETVAEEVDVTGGKVSFEAESFSTYVIVAPENASNANDFTYTLNNSKKTATIDKYTGSGGAVVIPSKVKVEGSTLEYTVTTIGLFAFRNCTSLTSVTIPASVTSIIQQAFSGCSNLETITFAENGALTSIGTTTFDQCTSLLRVDLPDTIEEIGTTVFNGCAKLETVTIPKNLTSIGFNAFNGCKGLTSIEVDPENEAYVSVDGILFTKDQKTLVKYPGNKDGASYAIPEGVETLAAGAFSFNNNLKEITIPDSVTTIAQIAFSNCTALEEIVIPETVKTMGGALLAGCSSLKSATILGNLTDMSNMFGSCKALEQITIPDSVTTIGNLLSYFSLKALKTVTINVSSDGDSDAANTLMGNLGATVGSLQTINVAETDTNESGATIKTVETYSKESGSFSNTPSTSKYAVIGEVEIELSEGDTVSKDESGNIVITDSSNNVTKYSSDGQEIHEHDYEATVTEPTCTEGGYTTYTCSGCGDSYTGDATDALGHDWGAPVWAWTGYTAATATFTCANNGDHVETVDATITSEVTTPANYGVAGTRTYTATVTLGEHTYTDTTSETIPALVYVDDGGIAIPSGVVTPTTDQTETVDIEEEATPLSALPSDLSAVTVAVTDENGETTEVAVSELPTVYADVEETAWSRDAIAYVSATGLMNGVGNNADGEATFSPTTGATGDMLTTVIYRTVSGETTSGENWADDAVAWAEETGLTDGIGLESDKTVTREQMVTMMYRAAKAQGFDVTATNDLLKYTDANKISDYARAAMEWAVSVGLIEGTDVDKLSPDAEVTREQIALIMMRFNELTNIKA